jgi:hypothetical protein
VTPITDRDWIDANRVAPDGRAAVWGEPHGSADVRGGHIGADGGGAGGLLHSGAAGDAGGSAGGAALRVRVEGISH